MKVNHPFFVIHKHDATSLHYDLRLQIGKVMPSWAVPKGPTLDNSLRRLAMQTTDHPMDYRNFEGVLPEGSYGAGPVIIWDEGYYIPEVELEKGVRTLVAGEKEGIAAMKRGLKKGELKFTLFGKRLHGSFALVKTKNFGPRNSWLLIKHKDSYIQKDYNANNFPTSARSKKTIEDLRKKL